MTDPTELPSSETFPVIVPREGGTSVTLTAAVPEMEQRTEPAPALLGGDRIGLYARLNLSGGDLTKPVTFCLSRLVGEEQWIIDAHFGANGYPHFSNGFGARYLRLKTVLPELADVLDTLARDRGLAAQIGRDTPLELAS